MKTYTNEDVKKAIETSKTWTEVMKKIGLKPAGGNAETMKKIASKNGFSTDHFLGSGYRLGISPQNKLKPEEIFQNNGKTVPNATLRRHAVESEIIKYECEQCCIEDEWNGMKIQLHLDHINGDRTNNHPSNLRFLCPNCHSQTPTYCRKKQKQSKKKSKCKKCKKEINYRSTHCKACSSTMSRKTNRPTKKELKQMIESMTWTAIGKRYGVSDNAVRKWAKSYEII